MIIIDKASEIYINTGSFTYDVITNSPDEIIVILVGDSGGTTTLTASYNNQLLTAAVASNTNFACSAYVITTPIVGSQTITITSAGGNPQLHITTVTLLGVDERTANFITAASQTSTLSITPPSANCLVIDMVVAGNNGSKPKATYPQIQLSSTQNGLDSAGNSYLYSAPSLIKFQWTNATSTPEHIAIVFEPNQSPSLWYPNIQFRSQNDVASVNNLDRSFADSNLHYFGYYPSNFYQNSFLHTVGRLMNFSNPVVTIISETEQETSQIIIDKVFQGQVAAVALSTVNLNMNVSIPSQDAVLVVTGGSVIATGAKWASVQFNGTSLTNLVQASVAGADAEIWYMPNPPVGTYTLSIASGTGGEIYANAMVLLGVDKTNTNIITASTTDAASTATIAAQITPDADNVLIIDTLASFDATAAPIADTSQTQVFNATGLAASEYVFSTFKLGSNSIQNMNYNLSAAVNASLVAAAFRPAHAPSQWFPVIDLREIDDTVTVSGLDASTNPAFGQYGYKPSTFWQNSFFHTVGRTLFPSPLLYSTLLDGIIVYYKFDENTGNNVYDSAVLQNHGAWQGTLGDTWYSNGVINSAGKFNGVDSYVSTTNAPALNLLNGFTIAGWVQGDGQGVRRFVSRGAVGNGWGLGQNGTLLRLTTYGKKDYDTVGNYIDPTKKQFIVCVLDSSNNANFYVNGVFVETVTGTVPAVSSPAVFDIGTGRDGLAEEFWNGLIDEVGVWGRSLSSFEIQRLYNNGQGLQFPFVYNQFAIAVQGYNPYSQTQRAYWQTSFLQTIGRIPIIPSAAAVVSSASTLLLMGVG